MSPATAWHIRLDELPPTAQGLTRELVLHLNFGGGKGAASYAIKDAEGRIIDHIGVGYNSKAGWRGFFLTGIEGTPASRHYATWGELRAAYAQARKDGLLP